MINPYKPVDTVTLRRRAEDRVRAEAANAAKAPAAGPMRDIPHELRVQQLLLEMQNAELRRVQTELDASRARYVDLYDLAPVGYVTLGEEGLILGANLTAANLLGVARNALVKQPLARFILPADQDAYSQYRQQLQGTPAARFCELRMVRLDGTPFWVLVEAVMAQGADGTPVCRAILSDITDRKRAEEALRTSEEKYRNLFSEMAIGCALHEIVCDSAGEPVDYVMLDVNAEFERLLSVKRADVIGRRASEMLPAAELSAWVNIFGSVALTGKSVHYEVYSESNEKHFEGTAFRTENGRFAGTFIDVTARKLSEEALARERQLLRTMIDNLPDAVYAKDAEGRKTLANRVDVASIGAATEAELLGKSDAELFPPEVADRLLADDMAVIRTGKPLLNAEELLVDAHGNRRWLLTSKIPLKDAANRVVGLVGIGHDITALKQAESEREKLEDQLRQAQKLEAVGRLAGGVAHDFNNMLQTILGTTELLLSSAAPNDPRTADLEEIAKAAQRSADLTRQLLAFARKQTIAPKLLDLNDTIAGTLKMLTRLIGENIDLVWKPAAELWPVKVDPSQLDQILANLTVNARDAIAGIGKVTIETGKAEFDESCRQTNPDAAPGAYVMLAVSDTGCGMDKETMAHLFEPFFTTKEQGKGTGLGLATVYGIVRQHDGFIGVTSEPGKGTTFRIYLPRYAVPAMETGEALEPDAAPRGTETVLVVEDETALLRLARRLLEAQGYTVLAAGGPGEALRLAGEYAGDIHVLLTDVVMPEMSGRDLGGKICTVRPGMKCLFMSGYTADAIAHHGVLDEGLHFIQKPFSRTSLAVKLREVLDGKAKG